MNQTEIGEFIAKCRKEKKLTQAQLAERLNITDRAVSKWEIHKNLGNRMKPGVPAHGASRFTTQLPLLQDRTGLDMPAQPGTKTAVQDFPYGGFLLCAQSIARERGQATVEYRTERSEGGYAAKGLEQSGAPHSKAEERRGVFPPAPRRVWGAGRRPAGKFRVAVRPALFKGRRGPTAR